MKKTNIQKQIKDGLPLHTEELLLFKLFGEDVMFKAVVSYPGLAILLWKFSLPTFLKLVISCDK
jgi:hypothetical protein